MKGAAHISKYVMSSFCLTVTSADIFWAKENIYTEIFWINYKYWDILNM